MMCSGVCKVRVRNGFLTQPLNSIATITRLRGWGNPGSTGHYTTDETARTAGVSTGPRVQGLGHAKICAIPRIFTPLRINLKELGRQAYPHSSDLRALCTKDVRRYLSGGWVSRYLACLSKRRSFVCRSFESNALIVFTRVTRYTGLFREA